MAIDPFTGEFEHTQKLQVRASLVRAHDGCPDVTLHLGNCSLSVNHIAHLSGPEVRAKLTKWILEMNGFSEAPEIKPPETPSRFERDEVI